MRVMGREKWEAVGFILILMITLISVSGTQNAGLPAAWPRSKIKMNSARTQGNASLS